jgi:hypothetical protein
MKRQNGGQEDLTPYPLSQPALRRGRRRWRDEEEEKRRDVIERRQPRLDMGYMGDKPTEERKKG